MVSCRNVLEEEEEEEEEKEEKEERVVFKVDIVTHLSPAECSRCEYTNGS